MVEWWKEALDKWGAALSFTYEAYRDDGKEVGERRITGEWFRCHGAWCVQLDMLYVARIHRESLEESIRQALSLTLSAIHKTHADSANQQFRDVLQTLSGSSREQLLGMVQEHKLLTLLPSQVFQEPGYFFWIRFKRDDSSLPQTGLQTESIIEEVVNAWIAGGWYMWHTEAADTRALDEFGVKTVLLYQTCTSISGMIDTGESEEKEFRAKEIETESSRESARVFAESVSAMLESDASVSSLVLVSRKVRSLADVYPALAMLVLASRTANSSSYTPRVSLFDDQILLHWLRLLPQHLGQLLMDWMRFDVRTDKDDSLKRETVWNLTKDSVQEMEEILDGLVGANLNVSEAARMLYLHRNTLIHRIERIEQSTGLDIRNFFDAVQLWISLKSR